MVTLSSGSRCGRAGLLSALLALAALARGSFAARLSEGWRRVGARIGAGSGDLMAVGGPARSHCLLTLSGCELPAAQLGSLLGYVFPTCICFRQPGLWAGSAGAGTLSRFPSALRATLLQPHGQRHLSHSPSRAHSSVGSANTIASFQVDFSPSVTLSGFVPWHRALGWPH